MQISKRCAALEHSYNSFQVLHPPPGKLLVEITAAFTFS
jgi:hypothetical protein